MSFKVGETVVYPHHGAATIEAINKRTMRGVEKVFLTLRVAQGDLTIQVPAENVEMVGVRDVVDADGLKEVGDVLRADNVDEPSNWSRRYKANVEKIATGDIVKVSEVVRDLTRRDWDRGLSAGEKRMLAKARQILISELALARDTDEETAETRLDKVLAEAAPDLPLPDLDEAVAGDSAGEKATEPAESKTAQPESTQLDSAQPKSTQPKSTQPDSAQPESTEANPA